MADNQPGWSELFSTLLTQPEKGALLLVILAGSWRWLRELWRSGKEESHHETLIETLLKENKELREELRQERKDRMTYSHGIHERDHGDDHESDSSHR